MFTGIIEQMGEVVALVKEQDNLHISVKADFTHELKIDQSVAHNGICLTVVAIDKDVYTVTAIKETLDKSKNYYVYCRSGARSANACAIMNELGFENAYNLLGGIIEWDGDIVEP